jgi:hypothetical protein
MTKFFARLTVFVLVGVLASCATMCCDRNVYATGEQIAKKINEKLAMPISLLNVFDVRLYNSHVKFDQASGRMTTTMDAKLGSMLSNKTVLGKIGFSGKLRFDAAKSAIVLDEPQMENFDFAETDKKYNDLINAMAKALGGDVLNGITVYKIKPEDLNMAGTLYSPKDLVVTDRGLQITLSPQR